MDEIRIGSRWQGRRGGGVIVVTGVYGDTVYLKSDRCAASGSREWFLLAYEPVDDPASRTTAEVRLARREQEIAELKLAQEGLQHVIAEMRRDLKIAREWNARHLATISQRPDAWTLEKVKVERDEARATLEVVKSDRDAHDRRAAEWQHKVGVLQPQVEGLKDELDKETRARKYADEQRDARVRDVAERDRELQSLRMSLAAHKQERAGKVERQRAEIARLCEEVEHQKKVTEARGVDSGKEIARLTSKSEALRGEVQRLQAAITKLAGHGDPALVAEVQRLATVASTLDDVKRERDEAHECLRRIKDMSRDARDDAYGFVLAVRRVLEWIS